MQEQQVFGNNLKCQHHSKAASATKKSKIAMQQSGRHSMVKEFKKQLHFPNSI